MWTEAVIKLSTVNVSWGTFLSKTTVELTGTDYAYGGVDIGAGAIRHHHPPTDNTDLTPFRMRNVWKNWPMIEDVAIRHVAPMICFLWCAYHRLIVDNDRTVSTWNHLVFTGSNTERDRHVEAVNQKGFSAPGLLPSGTSLYPYAVINYHKNVWLDW